MCSLRSTTPPKAQRLKPDTLAYWDNTSDATSGINDITLSSWDRVYVRMEQPSL